MSLAGTALLTALAAAPAPQPSLPVATNCPGSQIGGWIGRIEPYPPSASTHGVPLRMRRLQKGVPVGEGAPLCAGDIIKTPLGSKIAVTLVITGGDRPRLLPGQEYMVHAPSLLSRIHDGITRFDSMIGALLSPGSVMGPEDQGLGLPAPEIRAVAAWGPLRLMATGATLRSGTLSRPVAAYNGWIIINLASDCKAGCILVFDGGSSGSTTSHIQPVPMAGAPRPSWMAGSPTEPVDRATLGAFLAGSLGDTRWQAQGYSMLWSVACAVPAARVVVINRYPQIAGQDPCRGAD